MELLFLKYLFISLPLIVTCFRMRLSNHALRTLKLCIDLLHKLIQQIFFSYHKEFELFQQQMLFLTFPEHFLFLLIARSKISIFIYAVQSKSIGRIAKRTQINLTTLFFVLPKIRCISSIGSLSLSILNSTLEA